MARETTFERYYKVRQITSIVLLYDGTKSVLINVLKDYIIIQISSTIFDWFNIVCVCSLYLTFAYRSYSGLIPNLVIMKLNCSWLEIFPLNYRTFRQQFYIYIIILLDIDHVLTRLFPTYAGDKQWLYAVFSTESEAKSPNHQKDAARIGWKWLIKNNYGL